jgi:hypothetical protein
MPLMPWLQSFAALAALTLALLLGGEDADARQEGGLGLGGSAERTFMSPPVAPRATAIMAALDRTMTAPQAYPGGSLGGLFNRPGLLGGFAAGFLGAGLLGLLFGHGLLGGLGGVASFLGLLFQLALIVMLGRLIWTWWTGRNSPAFAGLSPRELADPYLRSRHELLPSDDVLLDSDIAPTAGEVTHSHTSPSKLR